MNDRPAPHNLTIERAILASIIRFGNISTVSDNRVDADTFYSPIHREIFKAALEIKSSGSVPDLLTVCERLNINDQLESVGGEIFMAELHNSIATDANIDGWIKKHLEYHAKRLMINRCNETLSECYISPDDAKGIFSNHRSGLKDIELFSCGMVQKPTIDKLTGFIGYLMDMQKGQGGHIIPFGITGLDSLVQLQKKQMFVVGGLSNTGKTRFILCDAIGKMKLGISTAIFSYENPENVIISGLVSIMSGIPFSDMTKVGGLTPAQMERMAIAVKFLKDNSNLLHIFGKGDYIHSVPGISAEVRRIQDNTSGSLKMIYIDYIQNMKSNKKNRVEQIESIITGISDIGAEYDIATMPLTQLNRDKDRDKSGRRPILSDMKGSGEIENAADYVAFLHRTCKDNGNVELDFYSEKVRGSQRFDEKILFNTFTGEMKGLVSRYNDDDRPNYHNKGAGSAR